MPRSAKSATQCANLLASTKKWRSPSESPWTPTRTNRGSRKNERQSAQAFERECGRALHFAFEFCDRRLGRAASGKRQESASEERVRHIVGRCEDSLR